MFDLLGREVAVLVNERKEAGRHAVTFDATGLASGTYFYRLHVTPTERRAATGAGDGEAEIIQTRMLTLLR